jgi:hypothetical protein
VGIFEDIWNKVARDDGTGTRIIRYDSKDDLLFIYASGFVDTGKCTFDEWKDSFKSTYRVTFQQWMEKEKFYYDGPVRVPFNTHQIPEKEFTEAELTDMFKKCMVPSSQTTVDKIPLFLKDYKQRGLLKDGKMMMTKEIKKELGDFITFYPSPLRVLEVNVQRMLRGEAAVGTGAAPSKTGFTMGKSTVRTTQAQLDTILGGSKGGPAGPTETEKDLSVKDLQKQVKKKTVYDFRLLPADSFLIIPFPVL